MDKTKIKGIAYALLFPPRWILLLLLPTATAFLLFSMLCLGESSPLTYLSYALAFYTLTIWCAALPGILRFFKTVRRENPYARRWFDDRHLRMRVSLTRAFLWSTAYAVFQLCLGIYHESAWYYATAAYYASLAVMRLLLSRHTRKYAPGERIREELYRARALGIGFLFTNLAVSAMLFFMLYRGRTFHHHEITTIAMAAYTFTSFTVALVGLLRHRRLGSPLYMASRTVGLASACVSMITLEATMLTTFGGGEENAFFRSAMMLASGAALSVFLIAAAVLLIGKNTRALKEFEHENGETKNE